MRLAVPQGTELRLESTITAMEACQIFDSQPQPMIKGDWVPFKMWDAAESGRDKRCIFSAPRIFDVEKKKKKSHIIPGLYHNKME